VVGAGYPVNTNRDGSYSFYYKDVYNSSFFDQKFLCIFYGFSGENLEK
jgi:hypothetical protein